MLEFFLKLFSSEFLPDGHGYFWTPSILWTSVLSDLLFGISYYSIPLALYIFFRKRRDLSFGWIFFLFALFIFACGTTHFLEVWSVWHGSYRLLALVKFITGVLSVITAILIWPLIHKLVRLPSQQLLVKANEQLAEQIAEREKAEASVRTLNAQLQNRIHDAAANLSHALVERDALLQREKANHMQIENIGRIKDEFLATLSHELRNPLNAITGWTQVLNSTTLDPEAREAVAKIQRNATGLSQIINNLFDMSSMQTGSIKINFGKVDVSQVVTDVFDTLVVSAAGRNITIERELGSDIPPIKGDTDRIRQVVWNLVLNAIKFSPDGSRIKVRLSQSAQQVQLSVADQGVGISETFMSSLFEMFTQENPTLIRQHQGLGLGLSIARQIAELHGGTIVAFSEGPQMGSTFTLSLPKGF